ncbi:hypothetical protein ACIGHN_13330 [Acidovorax sp. NPDC077693]|uniref:hypothetical protein n=1 Tax=unclassified Acidovorax TaxID=2684926 RepID=UPI0037C5514C
MPEPTSTAAGIASLAVTAVSTTAVTAFGIPLGLRADLLVAGLFGGLAAIIVLNTVPSTGDTWRELVRTTVKRMCVAMASSLTAGYLTPMFAYPAFVGEPWQLGAAFVIGAFAQRMLMIARDKVYPPGKPGNEGGAS